MHAIRQLGVVFLVSVLPIAAIGAEDVAGAKNEKVWKGTLTTVDTQDKTVTAKKWYVTKTFNVGDNCTIAALNNKDASLSDLSPGEKVMIRFQESQGVLVADRIAEKALRYSGTVEAVDPKAASLTVEKRSMLLPDHMTLRLAADCKVFLSDGKQGTVGDLMPGDKITVIYELPEHSQVAYRIREHTSTYVGTVDAIDLSERSVKAKEMFGEKKFDLGDHCQIIAGGKENGSLMDLTLGKKYKFTYENVNGVNIVNHIAPAQETKSSETASMRSPLAE